MQAFHASIGLTDGMKRLKDDVQRAAGRGRNDRGRSFEHTCAEVLQSALLPMLSARTSIPVGDMLVVKNIKLGMASSKGTASEFDSIVCARVDGAEAAGLHAKYKVQGGMCNIYLLYSQCLFTCLFFSFSHIHKCLAFRFIASLPPRNQRTPINAPHHQNTN